jgi:hypothetical protein
MSYSLLDKDDKLNIKIIETIFEKINPAFQTHIILNLNISLHLVSIKT